MGRAWAVAAPCSSNTHHRDLILVLIVRERRNQVVKTVIERSRVTLVMHHEEVVRKL